MPNTNQFFADLWPHWFNGTGQSGAQWRTPWQPVGGLASWDGSVASWQRLQSQWDLMGIEGSILMAHTRFDTELDNHLQAIAQHPRRRVAPWIGTASFPGGENRIFTNENAADILAPVIEHYTNIILRHVPFDRWLSVRRDGRPTVYLWRFRGISGVDNVRIIQLLRARFESVFGVRPAISIHRQWGIADLDPTTVGYPDEVHRIFGGFTAADPTRYHFQQQPHHGNVAIAPGFLQASRNDTPVAPRDGGRNFVNALDRAQNASETFDRVYLVSWGEVTEGSQICPCEPANHVPNDGHSYFPVAGGPYSPEDRQIGLTEPTHPPIVSDRWADTDDPEFFVNQVARFSEAMRDQWDGLPPPPPPQGLDWFTDDETPCWYMGPDGDRGFDGTAWVARHVDTEGFTGPWVAWEGQPIRQGDIDALRACGYLGGYIWGKGPTGVSDPTSASSLAHLDQFAQDLKDGMPADWEGQGCVLELCWDVHQQGWSRDQVSAAQSHLKGLLPLALVGQRTEDPEQDGSFQDWPSPDFWDAGLQVTNKDTFRAQLQTLASQAGAPRMVGDRFRAGEGRDRPKDWNVTRFPTGIDICRQERWGSTWGFFPPGWDQRNGGGPLPNSLVNPVRRARGLPDLGPGPVNGGGSDMSHNAREERWAVVSHENAQQQVTEEIDYFQVELTVKVGPTVFEVVATDQVNPQGEPMHFKPLLPKTGESGDNSYGAGRHTVQLHRGRVLGDPHWVAIRGDIVDDTDPENPQTKVVALARGVRQT